MNDVLITLIATTFFLLFGIVMLVAVAVLCFFYVRYRIRFRQTMMLRLGDSMGLAKHENGGIPMLQGKINGVNVIVDVIYQTYARPEPGIRSKVCSLTRVRANLPAESPIQVRPRKQRRYEKTPERLAGWSLLESGDTRFDQHFETFVKDELAHSAILTTNQRNALLDAKSVHIRKGAAVWLHLNMPKDIATFERAVHSCVRVAASFGQEVDFGSVESSQMRSGKSRHHGIPDLNLDNDQNTSPRINPFRN